MNLTGLDGQASCACAAKDRTSSATQSKIRFMNLSYMHVHSMRVASGEEVLVARALTTDGKVGFGFTFRLDAAEARHMAEWHAGEPRPLPRVIEHRLDLAGTQPDWNCEPGFTALEFLPPLPPGSSAWIR